MSPQNIPPSAPENAGQLGPEQNLKTKLLTVTQQIRERIEANGRNVYFDEKDNAISLETLDTEEQKLLADILDAARTCADGYAFTSYWINKVAQFYDARDQDRATSQKTAIYAIAQDLNGRLDALGKTRQADYRDELEEIVVTQFDSRQSFCDATGLDAAILNDVLARRAHFSTDVLRPALAKIGYRIQRTILTDLDKEERELLNVLQTHAATHPDWTEFENFSNEQLTAFYKARGKEPKDWYREKLVRFVEKIGERLAIASGKVRAPEKSLDPAIQQLADEFGITVNTSVEDLRAEVGLGRLADIFKSRLQPSEGVRPGRPTDESWEHRRRVPMSSATLLNLAALAEKVSTPERKVSPMQLAAQLLEDAIQKLIEQHPKQISE